MKATVTTGAGEAAGATSSGGNPAALYWILLGSLGVAHVVVIACLPVLPGQDLAQHLSYVRILRDYTDSAFPFSRFFELPNNYQPYFTTHLLLVGAARLTSIDVAIKVAYGAYAVAMLAGFHRVVASQKFDPGQRGPHWAGLLGSMFVWNPVVLMGFVPFMATMPVFLLGCSALLYRKSRLRRIDLVLAFGAAAILSSTHAVAAGAFVIFAVIIAVATRTRRAVDDMLLVALVAVAVQFLWTRFAEHGLGRFGGIDWKSAWAAHGVFALPEALDARWSPVGRKTEYLRWSILGPYPSLGQFAVGAALASLFAAAGLAALRERRYRVSGAADLLPVKATCGFLALSIVMPWGIYVPSEITYLDMRLLALAAPLVVAVAMTLTPQINYLVAAAAAAVPIVVFGSAASAFATEAMPARLLLRGEAADKTLLPVVLDPASNGFAPYFEVHRFVPLYYTIDRGGIAALFWGRYAPHLPVGYRPGMRPPTPPESNPGDLGEIDLRAFDLVLMRRSPTDRRGLQGGGLSDGASPPRLTERFIQERCSGGWCLIELRRRERWRDRDRRPPGAGIGPFPTRP